ncbi:MAG: hypothetical protein QXU98_01935, partial [Candidatus Parvarchaeota archaeon]
MPFLGSSAFRDSFKSLSIKIVISAVMVIISLRSFIFGYGFYDYADQFWSPSLNHPGIFQITYQGSYISMLSLGKEFITWPAMVIEDFFLNPVFQGKAFTIYTFIIFIAFSYVLAELLFRLLSSYVQLKTGFIGKELIEAFFVVIIYSNIAIMNLNVDGGTFSDGLIMLLIAISIVFSLLSKSKLLTLTVTSSLMSLSILLDPDYYILFVVAIFVSFLLNYRFKLWERFVMPAATVLLSMPVLYYVIEGMLITSVGIGNSLAVRPISYATAYSGYNPIAFVLLIAHLWSTYAISPPSILLFINKSTFIPFFGDIVLLPDSFLTVVWVTSLALYPLLSLVSLIFKNTRRIAIPFSAVWLASFIFTQWWRIPYLNKLFYRLSNLPVVGPAIGTALSLPGHYMNGEAIAETVLLGILIFNIYAGRFEIYSFLKRGGFAILLGLVAEFIAASFFLLYSGVTSKSSQYWVYSLIAVLSISACIVIRVKTNPFLYKRVTHRTKLIKRSIRVAVIVLIVFVVIMTGWQAFNGSFFPPRSYTGNSNGILTSQSLSYSPLSPQYIPNYVVDTYSALSSSTSYNTVFYSPTFPNNHFGYQDNILNYLIFNNYSFAIPSFMRTEGIKYIVTYDDSPSILSALNSSGLEHSYIGPSSYLYVNSEIFPPKYEANLLLNYSQNNNNYLFSYGIFESMNVTPVVSNTGSNTLGFDTLSD